MGRMKDALEQDADRVCPECGADMSENEDGELECDNPGWCMSQVDAMERADTAQADDD